MCPSIATQLFGNNIQLNVKRWQERNGNENFITIFVKKIEHIDCVYIILYYKFFILILQAMYLIKKNNFNI